MHPPEGGWHKCFPAWSVKRIDWEGAWSPHERNETPVEVVKQLGHLESMTWADLLTRSNGKHHAIETWKIVKEAQDRLVALKLDDLDEIVSLRLSGKHRVFGFLHEHVYYVLWWDPEHEVCPSVKG